MLKGTMKIEYDNCPPNADAMIQSLRAFGYDLGMAIADLIDNSISAGGNNLWVVQKWDGADSFIYVLDDGSGMDEKTLFEAMRLGTKSPLDERDPDDLGRFGLGLKTASFSQCRLLTVRTKTVEGKTSTRCWDLDYINEVRDWHLLRSAKQANEAILKPLANLKSGTIVLWQNLDRVVEVDDVENEQGKNDFLRKIDDVQKYLSMVFHRYIGFRRDLNIRICGPDNIDDKAGKIKSWDPFLISHVATQELSTEAFKIFGNKITVKPFVLPHISKLTSIEHSNASGPKGWNAHQGFYVYRKERLILAGGWLDLGYKQEDHYKLARILLDIPNNMDEEWKIDVKKSEAHPPDSLRQSFKRIAKITRERASRVYRYRGKIELRKANIVKRFVWKKLRRRGKVSYKIDRNHPLVQELINRNKNAKKDIKTLIQLIEDTVPIEQIVITNSEHPDSHIKIQTLDDCDEMPIKKWFLDQIEVQMNNGASKKDAIIIVMSMEPFDQYPELISLIEGNYNGC